MSLVNDKIILQEADIEGVGDLVQRAQNRLIVDHDDNKMDKVPTAVEGNVAAFDANGQVVDAGDDINDKMDKVPTATQNNFAKFNASGEVVDSNLNSTDFMQSVGGANDFHFAMFQGGQVIDSGASITEFNDKVDRVPSAVVGNVAAFDANGQILDSGLNLDVINYVYDSSFVAPSGTGDRSLAIGDDAQTDAAEDAVAIGTGARAETADAIAIGRAIANVGARNIAIGDQCRATGSMGTFAIGRNVQNSEANSLMMGNGSDFNTLHLKDQGRMHLLGDNAAYNVPEYTVATVPTGGEGDLIYVTDGDAGSKCLAFHDGTNWKVISLGAAISTT